MKFGWMSERLLLDRILYSGVKEHVSGKLR
jgi:hypothetical protein